MKLLQFVVMAGSHTDAHGKRYSKGDVITTADDLAKKFGEAKFRPSGSAPAPTAPCATTPVTKTLQETSEKPEGEVTVGVTGAAEEPPVFDDGETMGETETAKAAEADKPLFEIALAKPGWWNVVNVETRAVMNAKPLRKASAEKLINELNG